MVDPKILRLKGDVEAMLLHYAADRFVKMHDDAVNVELDTSGSMVVKNILSPTDALAAASLIAVVIRVILKTRIWLQKRAWTEARIRKAIEQALAGEGVKEYQITEIKNLNCLRGEGPCPCIISAESTSTRKGYDINIFLDGKVLTFQVASRIVA